MTASLPMYDRPETQAAQSAFWHAIRTAYASNVHTNAAQAKPRDLPPDLIGPDDLMAHWRDPALVFSQTCGLPFRLALHRDVTLIATPDYGLPGCPPGYYNSVIVTRADDTRAQAAWPSMTFALNSYDSQSGWAAPKAHLGTLGLTIGAQLITGGHRQSARAVLNGHADLAGLDAQTWRMMQRWDGWSDGLRERARTAPTPGLPYITARNGPVQPDNDTWIEILTQALQRLAPQHRETLDLKGVASMPADRYLGLAIPPEARIPA